ncbi:hypothetical protein HYDPIDRAFT_104976 [Hydnomerulius pinastri MD-312]|nr:hypothetical protein HYDPIDRAFT_104976 [Hydnomerulius pinastri MD-312]
MFYSASSGAWGVSLAVHVIAVQTWQSVFSCARELPVKWISMLPALLSEGQSNSLSCTFWIILEDGPPLPSLTIAFID